jgi:hypothetical protein
MSKNHFFNKLKQIVQTGAGKEMFHEIHHNNYTFVLVSKHIDYDFFCKDTVAALSVLNDVVIALYEFSKKAYQSFISQHPPGTAEKAELYKKVALFLEYWKKDLDAGNYFLSYNYIKITGQGFDMMGLPYIEYLRNEGRDLCSRLLHFDRRYKHLIKIDLYLNDNEVAGFFTALCSEIKKQPHLFESIERIEVANPEFTETFVTKAVNLRYYPKIIIYPNKDISSINDETVAEIRQLLQRMMTDYGEYPMDTAFCTPFAKNSTITQGYRNYKKIMQVVNLLDEVYDPESGYSLLKTRQEKPVYETAR